MNIKNMRVMVVGMALSGLESAKYLSAHGAHVSICDIKDEGELKEAIGALENYGIEIITGRNPEPSDEFDMLVLSPGIPTNLGFIREARARGVEVIGELELASRTSEGRIIAITGTNGKTTTTALTGEIFKNAKKKTFVVGNIGVPAISVSDSTDDKTYLITEASSFQLETITGFKPATAAILNVTPDHLNRHGSMEEYIEAKKRVFMNMDEGMVVLNYDNDITRDIGTKIGDEGPEVLFFSTAMELQTGAFIKDGKICIRKDGFTRTVCKTDEVFIPGRHNLENALAAIVIADCHNIDHEVIRETLRGFKGVEHRIEFVDEIGGVRYFNDSKGTNPDASIKAVEAFDGPIVLIAGGMDKGSDFTSFIQAFAGKVKEMVVLGETAEKIIDTAEKLGFNNTFRVSDMQEAVKRAHKISENGDCVLLSPACASWDMYKSYEFRGKDFKERVKELRD